LLLFSYYFFRQFRDGNPFGRLKYGFLANRSVKTLKVYLQALNDGMFFILFSHILKTTGKPSRFVVFMFTLNLPDTLNAELLHFFYLILIFFSAPQGGLSFRYSVISAVKSRA